MQFKYLLLSAVHAFILPEGEMSFLGSSSACDNYGKYAAKKNAESKLRLLLLTSFKTFSANKVWRSNFRLTLFIKFQVKVSADQFLLFSANAVFEIKSL